MSPLEVGITGRGLTVKFRSVLKMVWHPVGVSIETSLIIWGLGAVLFSSASVNVILVGSPAAFVLNVLVRLPGKASIL
jgi:hypothetical protein